MGSKPPILEVISSATSTVVTKPREIRVPAGETIEKATAHSGIEINIAAMVTGGVKVDGRISLHSFVTFNIHLCVSQIKCCNPNQNSQRNVKQVRVPRI